MSSHDYSTDPDDPRNRGGLLPGQDGNEQEAEPEHEAHPVDQIAVRKLGGFNFLDTHQWAMLPRVDRARLIKSGSVWFLHQGQEVPMRSALLYLQTRSTPRASRLEHQQHQGFLGFDVGTPRPGEA